MSSAASVSDGQPWPDRVPWRAHVGVEAARIDAHWRHLDAAERLRAARFRTAADRLRFVVARSGLRQLLGRRLGLPAHAVAFASNAFGKPLLRDAPQTLHFNISHSGDWVLIALDATAPIGIDVEAIRPELACLDDYDSVLSAQELQLLRALPPAQRAAAFARLWVRKEAYAKALGEGLNLSLRDVDVGVDALPTRPPGGADRTPAQTPEGWCFEDVPLDAQHVACLVRRNDVTAV